MRNVNRKNGTDQNVVQTQAEIRDEIDKERLKRFAREYRQSQDMENALASLSDFEYKPVDYYAAMIRKPWVEPTIPDYSYLLTEAKMKVTNKYQGRLIVESVLGIFFIIFTLAFHDTFLPIISVTAFLGCIFGLHTDMQRRHQELTKALSAAREIIDARVTEQRDSIERAREAFEEAENVRIERINKLLSGDPSAVFERMEEIIRNCRLPFFMRCTIDYANDEPVLTLNLPATSVIPTTIVTLTPNGACEYEDKSAPEIYRQYVEALAGTAMNFAVLVFSYLPTLSVVYVRGLMDTREDQECLFGVRVTRQDMLQTEQWRSGLDAFHDLGAIFELESTGALEPINPPLPNWWGRISKDQIRTVTVGCQPRF